MVASDVTDPATDASTPASGVSPPASASPLQAPDATDPAAVAAFVQRWSTAALSERSNYVSFLKELCALLDLPQPEPAVADNSRNAYVFERAIPVTEPSTGKVTTKFIDLYKRGCFILEAKQYDTADPEPTPAYAAALSAQDRQKKSGVRRDTAAWDRRMLEAHAQAEFYLHHLPSAEPAPVFLIVIDVGHSFELYADFSQKGRAPLHFPDPRTYRLRLADLAKPEVRRLLRTIWTDPASLDPARKAAAVTREVAAHLAELARLFERKHEPAAVAAFLSRCLFCMFAEDIGLLPPASFTQLLDSVKDDPGAAVPLLKGLFEEMNHGGYSLVLRKTLLHFNGGLFADPAVLPLDGLQLGLLRRAAALEWRHVEPAIFGTLLERALDPTERHKLGAHYTPRAYVERLVLPTVMEPLRDEWGPVRAAAVALATRGDLKGAIKEARAFHHRLCAVRVLDPACGSGNFLYVTLEHLKRLEGEVLELIESFGENMRLDLTGETVDPHQFLGIELNPRAATVAELVLWIGYLQWHHRNRGATEWPEPVLRAFKNIECRDAVLAYDQKGYLTDTGEYCPGDQVQATRLRYVWDRRTTKTDPVTGRAVPDETAVVPVEAFRNPRPAPWPQADFIVGNPPFLGTSRMRDDLGDGYAQTLRTTYPEIPESADFVMYWWHKAAEECIAGRTRRFGFITTNSIRQTFNRRVVQRAMDRGIYLTFAIPDHPWIDAAQCAAVRIAMTVGAPRPDLAPVGATPVGELSHVAQETAHRDTGEHDVQLSLNLGKISADLSSGADVAGTTALESNEGLANRGFCLFGAGFIITHAQAIDYGLTEIDGIENHVRPYRNGRDLADKPRGAYVIDLFGLTTNEARERFPAVYEHVLRTVKPDRDANKRESRRKNWWVFGEPNKEMRRMLACLSRYITTVETSKHRYFQFLEAEILPDNKLVVVALSDAFHLGVLSSRIHCRFALASGSWLGVGNDPVYAKTRCFDPFPFPDCPEAQKAKIRDLAEALDAHRKRAQAEHGLGLTDIYNVLEKVRAEQDLTTKDKRIHEQALVSTLKQLHDDLDRAVAEAYGWADIAEAWEDAESGTFTDFRNNMKYRGEWPSAEAYREGLKKQHQEIDAEILTRLVALNAHRATEEAEGLIRWLRPEYQSSEARGPAGGGPEAGKPEQTALDLTSGPNPPLHAPGSTLNAPTSVRRSAKPAKRAWPPSLAERTKAIDALLATEPRPLTTAEITKKFSRAKEPDVQEILETLAALGRLRPADDAERWVR